MTELNRAGQAESLGHIDTTQGQFRSQIDVVADELRQLAGNADIPGDPLTAPYVLYVNGYTGIDTYVDGDYRATGDLERRISMQRLECGYSEARPFRTINRAALEAAIITSRDWMTDAGRENALVSIVVMSGNHDVLNGRGLVESEANFPEWDDGHVPTNDELNSFNPNVRGGLILPRGCSLVSLDLRKTQIRPTFVPAADDEAADLSNRGAIFRVTGTGYYYGFTFRDQEGSTTSHHLLSCFEFASEDELDEFYAKVLDTFQGISAANTVTQRGEFQIVGPQPDVPDERVDTVASASPYIYNCSIRSTLGLCGILADGNVARGFRSMVVAQFTGVALQRDMTCWQRYVGDTWQGINDYDQYIGTPQDNLRMDPDRLSFHIRAINNAVIQEVSVFAIGQGIHHWVQSGGELTVTNSNSNFGGCAAVGEGYKANAFEPDETWNVNRLRVATNMAAKTGNIKRIQIGTIENGVANDATTITLTADLEPGVFDEDIPRMLERLHYTFFADSFIWVENSRSEDYRARLTAAAWSPLRPNEINVTAVFENEDGTRPGDPVLDDQGNPTGLFFPDLEGSRVYIRRIQDTRSTGERRYALLQSTTNASARTPLRNYVLQTNESATSINGPIPETALLGVATSAAVVDEAGNDALVGLRRLNPNTVWVAGTYYRPGQVVRRENKHWNCTLENNDTVWDVSKWAEAFVHMPEAYNAEDYFKNAQPSIYFDNDTDGTEDSLTLGYDWDTVWNTDARIQGQYRTATDYQGMHSFLVSLGFSNADAHTILLPRPAATRDRNPRTALDGIANPNGAANVWTNWPIEFRRPSSIRLFGHAYEWAGFANYTKGLPQYQQGLSSTNKFTYYFTNVGGGRVYGSGFNEEGFLVTPQGVQDLTTGEEAGFDALAGAQPTDEIEFPTFYESLSVNTMTVNTDFILNGTVTGTPGWGNGFGDTLPELPIATAQQRGIVELATNEETQALASNSLAVTPEGLGAALGDTETEIITIIGDRLAPAGAVQYFAGTVAPAGWLLCNGDTVPNGNGTVQGQNGDFSALFALLGTTYGGAGILPDLRGQFLRGFNEQGAAGPDAGRVFGSNQDAGTAPPTTPFTATTNNAGNHDHSYATNQGTGGGQGGGGADTGSRNGTTNQAGGHTHDLTFTGGGDDETRPVNIAMLAIIKF